MILKEQCSLHVKITIFSQHLGESISSETSNGFNNFNETEISLTQWKTFDEGSDIGVADVAIDADTTYSWQKMNYSKATILAGKSYNRAKLMF